MGKILVNTKNMPREEWLKYRRMGIGGSDAGAIIGLNPYVTPYALWADKTGRMPDQEDNEAMRQGRDLEAYVASRFEEATGKKVRKRNVMFQHDTFDFAVANIDREAIGEKAGLECKTTSVLNLRKFKNGDFPDQYYTQCVHYLAVTGWQKWYLAVLVLNHGFFVYEIERDEEEISALMQAEKEFWETYIVPDIAPPVDGLSPTTEAISSIYPGGDDDVVTIHEYDILRSYIDLKAQIKAMEQEKEKCEQLLKDGMKDAENGICGDFSISWKRQERNTFDSKQFAKDHPEIDLSGYYKKSSFRVFKVKEVNGGK